MQNSVSYITFLLLCVVLISCEPAPSSIIDNDTVGPVTGEPKYSLAQWSFNRELFANEMNTIDFIEVAGEMGFAGVEYVSQFFQDQVSDTVFLARMNAAAAAAGVKSLLIMVDGAGNLGASDPEERQAAIEQHQQWVLAAKQLGCTAIRVNAHGDGSPDAIKQACLDGIGRLARWAKTHDIDILIENHGGISNNGAWLADLLKQLHPYGVGSLPDFDNWCTQRANGRLWGADCTERYNAYQGMLELMPFAKAVSVKSFAFTETGEETTMDYGLFFDIIKGANYDGYLGIEYEGDDLPSRAGVLQTKALAERSWHKAAIVDEAAKARLDSTLSQFVTSGQLAGVSALIFEEGEEVYFNAFGWADREAEQPMDRHTITQIYSMTKPITGVALMQLYEAGKFKLDDPLAQYAPEFAAMDVYEGLDSTGAIQLVAAKRPISIRDLTRHTAGLYNGNGLPGLQELWEAADVRNPNNTLTEMAAKLSELPLYFQPGERWAYGLSVDMQAYLVELIAGQPFDDYIQEHILDPLGMQETRYFVPPADRGRMAATYRRMDDGTLTRLPNEEAHQFNINPQRLSPGGFGLTSTLDDYMRFTQMLVNGGSLDGVTILAPETVQLMATNHLSDTITERMWLPSKGQMGFGIDFAVRMRPPASVAENNGAIGEFFWDGAASTLFWVDPANKLTAVLFVQLFPYDQIGLHKGFRDAVYGPVQLTEQEEAQD